MSQHFCRNRYRPSGRTKKNLRSQIFSCILHLKAEYSKAWGRLWTPNLLWGEGAETNAREHFSSMLPCWPSRFGLTTTFPHLLGHFGSPTIHKAPASNTAVKPGDPHALPVPSRPVPFHSSPHDTQHSQGLSPSLTLCLPLPGYKGDRCYQGNIWNLQREDTMQRLLVAEYSEVQDKRFLCKCNSHGNGFLQLFLQSSNSALDIIPYSQSSGTLFFFSLFIPKAGKGCFSSTSMTVRAGSDHSLMKCSCLRLFS